LPGGKRVEITEDLIDCHEDSGNFTLPGGQWIEIAAGSHGLPGGQQKVSIFQVGKGTEMGSVDSIDCQEGSREIPYCQVGRDEQMRLSEGLINSEMIWISRCS
jgi:hypothetical protein